MLKTTAKARFCVTDKPDKEKQIRPVGFVLFLFVGFLPNACLKQNTLQMNSLHGLQNPESLFLSLSLSVCVSSATVKCPLLDSAISFTSHHGCRLTFPFPSYHCGYIYSSSVVSRAGCGAISILAQTVACADTNERKKRGEKGHKDVA